MMIQGGAAPAFHRRTAAVPETTLALADVGGQVRQPVEYRLLVTSGAEVTVTCVSMAGHSSALCTSLLYAL